ncbi:uncharacterized protein LOC110256283 [Sus scrofa]|uniref:uncharacterized protein LOC110256283 n=1 Tax=Sus scrofa TaxID=9823 RepID=UPI000A2B424D|nr:uncharacterized protein LOC110256283 [Sus scrofa]
METRHLTVSIPRDPHGQNGVLVTGADTLQDLPQGVGTPLAGAGRSRGGQGTSPSFPEGACTCPPPDTGIQEHETSAQRLASPAGSSQPAGVRCPSLSLWSGVRTPTALREPQEPVPALIQHHTPVLRLGPACGTCCPWTWAPREPCVGSSRGGSGVWGPVPAGRFLAFCPPAPGAPRGRSPTVSLPNAAAVSPRASGAWGRGGRPGGSHLSFLRTLRPRAADRLRTTQSSGELL